MRHFSDQKPECDKCQFSSETNDNMQTHKAKWHEEDNHLKNNHTPKCKWNECNERILPEHMDAHVEICEKQCNKWNEIRCFAPEFLKMKIFLLNFLCLGSR